MPRLLPRPKPVRSPIGNVVRVAASLVLLVAFVVTAFRVSSGLSSYTLLSRIEVTRNDAHGHDAVITKHVDLAPICADRPLRAPEPSSATRSGDVPFGSPDQRSIAALVPNAPWAMLGTRGSGIKTWTPDAPACADLMVFLN